jgi:hypothetical protein
VIYTTGFTESYEEALNRLPEVTKLGRTESYPGGSVWKTEAEARSMLPEGYSIYGVLADWDKDVAPDGGHGEGSLLFDRPIVRLTEVAP